MCITHLAERDAALVLGVHVASDAEGGSQQVGIHGIAKPLDFDSGGDDELLLGLASLMLDSGASVAALGGTPG